MDEKTTYGNGIGLGTILAIVFLVLKLCGVISWSWWWVFAPIWIPIGIAIIFVVIAFIVAFVTSK